MVASTIYHQLKLLILVQYFSNNDRVWGSVHLARDIVFVLFIYTAVVKILHAIWSYGITRIVKKIYYSVFSSISQKFMSLPFIKSKIDKELNETVKKIEKQVIQNDESLMQFTELPNKGLDDSVVTEELVKLQGLNILTGLTVESAVQCTMAEMTC